MKKNRFVLVILSILMVFITFYPPVEAEIRGKIEGTVSDAEENPLKGVNVTIISMRMASRKYTVKTNDEGKFTQIGLYPDYYQVSFKKDGFMPSSQEVRVRIDEASRLKVTLHKVEQMIEKQLSEADKLFLKGIKAYEAGNYEEAVKAYQEASQLGETQWAYFFNLGLAHKKTGNLEETTKAFAKAVELNPESYSCRKELGEALAKAKNFTDAKIHYEKAMELNAEDPDTCYNYGIVLIGLGESGPALQAFQKTVELKEDYADAYYQIGTIHIGQNNQGEAVTSLEKFLELAPDHPQAAIAKQLLDYLKKIPA